MAACSRVLDLRLAPITGYTNISTLPEPGSGQAARSGSNADNPGTIAENRNGSFTREGAVRLRSSFLNVTMNRGLFFKGGEVRVGSQVRFCILAVLLSSVSLLAESPRDSDPCHAMPTATPGAAMHFFNFDDFDKELRVALERQDPVALAFLVRFPLRVNDAGGSISLNDPAALTTRFQEVFTPAVRKEILSQRASDLGCNVEGIGYGRGVIWVNATDQGYAIWSVNRDSVPPYPTSRWNIPKIDYVCETKTHRIVIDSLTGGILRYRSWDRPRPVTEAPDLEVARGTGTFEGSDLCVVPIYTFKSGTTVYRVEGGMGCTDDSTPKDATGQLEVTVNGQAPVDSWCY